ERVALLPRDGPLRSVALVELIRLDLRHRVRRVEDYLSAYPELRAKPEAVVALRRVEEEASTQPALPPTRHPLGSGADAPSAPLEDAGASLPEQFGRYRILRKLGQGGMGAVYLAHDTQLDRQVALKVPRLRPGDGDSIERFQREARTAATL